MGVCAQVAGMRNSYLHNQKWDILEQSLWWWQTWRKIILLAGIFIRMVGKNKVTIKELKQKLVPRMIFFCPWTFLINRVFRDLSIFLSTRPIWSLFVIWTLLCGSLQTFVLWAQDSKFLISQFLTLLQFLISLLQFLYLYWANF